MLALALVSALGVRIAIIMSMIPGMLAAAAIIYAIRHTPRAQRTARQPLRLRVAPVLASPVGRLAPGIGLFEVGNIAAILGMRLRSW